MSVAGVAISGAQVNVVVMGEDFGDKHHNVEEDGALVAVVIDIGNTEGKRPGPGTRGRSATLFVSDC